MSNRILQIPELFFVEVSKKDKLYARIWFHWFSKCVDDIFNEDFVEKQQELYPRISTEILEIYKFGIQLLQDFNICTKKSKKEKIDEEVKKVGMKVIDYLNAKSGSSFMGGKNLELICARIIDGFSYSDFVVVIDKKVDEWKGTDMEKYLRPITLFSKTKFENYLNGARIEPRQSNSKVSKFTESISKAKQIIGVYKNQ
jgi:uncharacterized phage protein (TIGR02220 family)